MAPGLSTRTPYCLASNRFIPRKNLDGLLKAYHAYRSTTDHPWRLLLLGDGPERPALEHLIAEMQIDGVQFCGFQQIDVLPAYYAHAGAFVHPAHNDQWGLVVNEAMAAGLPVIVSNHAGCSTDLVQEGVNGFTFAPDDLTELTRLLRVMSSPDANRIAMSHASERIVDGWSPANFAHQMWKAVDAGKDRVHIPRRVGRLLTAAIQRASRGVHSFHSLKD